MTTPFQLQFKKAELQFKKAEVQIKKLKFELKKEKNAEGRMKNINGRIRVANKVVLCECRYLRTHVPCRHIFLSILCSLHKMSFTSQTSY